MNAMPSLDGSAIIRPLSASGFTAFKSIFSIIYRHFSCNISEKSMHASIVLNRITRTIYFYSFSELAFRACRNGLQKVAME